MSNRVITLLDSWDTLGQTLTEISVAMASANQLNEEVALVNLNFYAQPILHGFFNVTPEKSVADVFPVLSRLDGKMLKGFCAQYSSNIRFLDIPSKFANVTDYPPSQFSDLIALFKETFKFTFVTVGKRINQNEAAVLDMSDLLVITVSPHLFSLKQAQYTLNSLKELHYSYDFVKIIANNSGIKGGFSTSDIKEHLKVDVIGDMPSDSKVFFSAVNEAKLPVENSPHSAYSLAAKNIAAFLIKEDGNQQTIGKSIFSAGESLEKRSEKNETRKEENSKEIKSPEETVLLLKKKIHEKLLREIDMDDINTAADEESLSRMKNKMKGVIENFIAEEKAAGLSREMRTKIVSELLDDVLGLGPLEELLRQDDISEIMVNGPNDIYVEKGGKITLTDTHFTAESQLRTVIDRILAPIGRRVDESSPLVDARLKDGSRVNIVIPPLSLIGPTITIRKFGDEKLGMQDLIQFGSIEQRMIDFAGICVKLRKNIIISGGTGSGKTTLLNMVSSFIPDDERIVTIEDSAELKLRQRHVITLESKPPNIEGKGAITIQRLVINSLRMRPDRIIIGECRGGEALDMLQAMNTGHDGSLSTAHANSPLDAISRLMTMVIMAGTELPGKAIVEQIASAIQIVIQTSRFSDGSRKITHITEVIGIENGNVQLRDLFRFKQEGLNNSGKVIGSFHAEGHLPTFFDDIAIHGLKLSKGIFNKD